MQRPSECGVAKNPDTRARASDLDSQQPGTVFKECGAVDLAVLERRAKALHLCLGVHPRSARPHTTKAGPWHEIQDKPGRTESRSVWLPILVRDRLSACPSAA